MIYKIPQFDIITLGAQVFGLLITLAIFYYYSINITIPKFIEIKKFRIKKLKKINNLVVKINDDLTSNLWLKTYCYKKFLK
uniref:ATPase subunit 8 n=1 Tax=Lithodesmium undulatum TaxID=59812 RepID=A0A7T6UZP2_LITUN|nr:ATPase subunit 8 [Lithodesmium undulatum]QQJ94652.1 ATPase subunit 8 [Lithodesmium undulatum]